MRYVYYIDGEKYITDYSNRIPLLEISSPNEQIPAFENLATGFRMWCLKGNIYHRLTGPARIWLDGRVWFCLNDKRYENVKEWIKDHPEPDLYFNAIGVFTETDKILWHLQN
jgi:hypothetical protein